MRIAKQRNIVWIMTILYFMLVGFWAVGMRGAELSWVTTLLAYMPQVVFVAPGIVLLLWSLALMEWRMASWNLGILAFVAVALMGFNFPAQLITTPGSGPALRVMTLNLHHCAGGIGNIADAVKRAKPDIVCFQESNTGDWRSEVPSELLNQLPGYRVAKFRELATLSRYPIILHRVHRMHEETGRAILQADVVFKGRRITILNTHVYAMAHPRALLSNWGSESQNIRYTMAIRDQEVWQVLGLCKDARYPVIVSGDFNTPACGMIYARITGNLSDAFHQAGWGFGYTFKASQPLMRIDYVFAGKGIGVRNVSVPKESPSDHRPVVADLYLNDAVRTEDK